jgi:hypothetical protein
MRINESLLYLEMDMDLSLQVPEPWLSRHAVYTSCFVGFTVQTASRLYGVDW